MLDCLGLRNVKSVHEFEMKFKKKNARAMVISGNALNLSAASSS